eukprot:3934060-Rhodomonas_salina.5
MDDGGADADGNAIHCTYYLNDRGLFRQKFFGLRNRVLALARQANEEQKWGMDMSKVSIRVAEFHDYRQGGSLPVNPTTGSDRSIGVHANAGVFSFFRVRLMAGGVDLTADMLEQLVKDRRCSVLAGEGPLRQRLPGDCRHHARGRPSLPPPTAHFVPP